MKVKWTTLGLVFFLLLSLVMTGCFIWQYRQPKQSTEEIMVNDAQQEEMCPRFPEPVPLQHPIPILKEALEKVDGLLRQSINATSLPAISAIVIFNDSVLWNGNFGRKNGSDPFSPLPNEYTVYRIASLSKIFPVLMLYKFWEEGKVASLDDPLEKYMENFTIKNPLGKAGDSDLKSKPDGSSNTLERRARTSSVTLRRMASQLSGLPRRLRSTNLLWRGSTEAAVSLLQDDVLVADPGTKCHYSNLAFSLLGHVLAEKVAGTKYQRWVTENILNPLGMEDTGFVITPEVQSQMAVGFYSSGQKAPLYDLGWYQPSGQMFSTAADIAKLGMALLGSYKRPRPLLQPDTLKTMLTPVFRCDKSYFANQTGTPWEVDELLGYELVQKAGELDGYSATFSLVPRLKLGLVILMAGAKPKDEDFVTKAYSFLIPAMESAFREAPRVFTPPPSPSPYEGYFTYGNMTFYEIRAGEDGVLIMQQFGPQVETMVPAQYRTIRLSYLEDRVFRVVFEKEYPCVLRVNSASVSLENQDRQLFNFYSFNRKGLSPGFDAPGLNTYRVVRISRKPFFTR
ncbi:putative beta-lactamase-like 1 isoform X2 [Clupea harengus]|uniref:Beta-lactamase-like 1 isoform X2 n=1 Tax=Clupea harengus TaxID=7950 RepID=A0A6P3VMS9_CLUHA|nr:putative beta-lactamase-like 1 isoform X2 [Clupea harengus]